MPIRYTALRLQQSREAAGWVELEYMGAGEKQSRRVNTKEALLRAVGVWFDERRMVEPRDHMAPTEEGTAR